MRLFAFVLTMVIPVFAHAGDEKDGCVGSLPGERRMLLNNQSLVIVSQELLQTKKLIDIVDDTIETFSRTRNNGKTLSFEHVWKDNVEKISLTEVSRQKIAAKNREESCSRDRVRDVTREVSKVTYTFARGSEKPLSITLDCYFYEITACG